MQVRFDYLAQNSRNMPEIVDLDLPFLEGIKMESEPIEIECELSIGHSEAKGDERLREVEWYATLALVIRKDHKLLSTHDVKSKTGPIAPDLAVCEAISNITHDYAFKSIIDGYNDYYGLNGYNLKMNSTVLERFVPSIEEAIKSLLDKESDSQK